MTDGSVPTSIPDPGGRGVWEPRKDAGSGRIFWVNHTLRQTQWTVPGSGAVQSESRDPGSETSSTVSAAAGAQAAAGLDPARDKLPEGWERRFDPQSGSRFVRMIDLVKS